MPGFSRGAVRSLLAHLAGLVLHARDVPEQAVVGLRVSEVPGQPRSLGAYPLLPLLAQRERGLVSLGRLALGALSLHVPAAPMTGTFLTTPTLGTAHLIQRNTFHFKSEIWQERQLKGSQDRSPQPWSPFRRVHRRNGHFPPWWRLPTPRPFMARSNPSGVEN